MHICPLELVAFASCVPLMRWALGRLSAWLVWANARQDGKCRKPFHSVGGKK